MVDIADCIGLAAWFEGKPPELACILAARTALRVAPVLGNALCEDADSRRRRAIVLSGFRALAAASCTSTWPKRAAEIRKPVRVAAQEAMATVSDVAYGARLSVVEWTEAAPEEHESIWGAEADARSLGIASHGCVSEADKTIVIPMGAPTSDKCCGVSGPNRFRLLLAPWLSGIPSVFLGPYLWPGVGRRARFSHGRDVTSCSG